MRTCGKQLKKRSRSKPGADRHGVAWTYPNARLPRSLPPPTPIPSSGTPYSTGGIPAGALGYTLVAWIVSVIILVMLVAGCTEAVPGRACTGCLVSDALDRGDEGYALDSNDLSVSRGTEIGDGGSDRDRGPAVVDGSSSGADGSLDGLPFGACPPGWTCELRSWCEAGAIHAEVAGGRCGSGGSWRFTSAAYEVELQLCTFEASVAAPPEGATFIEHTPCSGLSACSLWSEPCGS